ncbi:MAG: glycosyltransferase family 39 protein [Chloroflexi bacterium]|nr:glycosyltransferase family 39 protein [Chloroflexota bacterium]
MLLAATLVVYAVLAFGYLSLTPVWQNPDEPAHYNYVAFVAATGGLPELKPGDWDSALLDRLKNGTLQPGDSITTIRYESWQPPLFYLLAAPLVRLTPTEDPASILPRLRGLDVVLGAITLILAYAVARQLLAPTLAVAVPMAIAGVPMFVAVSSALSADPLANLFAVAILLVLAKRPPAPTTRWSIFLGVLLGLGLLTKLELAIFVPIALGVVVFEPACARASMYPPTMAPVSHSPQRGPRSDAQQLAPADRVQPLADTASHRRLASGWLSDLDDRLRQCVVVLLTTGLVVSPWLVHQVTTYGWTDPLALARHSAVVADQQRFPGFSLDWLSQFLTISFHSFWAQFGWMAVVAPVRLYVGWGLVTLAAAAGLVLGRRRLRDPQWLLMLATVAIAFVAYVGYNLSFEQFQARYVFTAITPLAALLVLGWSSILPRRSQPWGVLLLTAALVAVNAYTLVRVLVPGFAASG